MAGIRKWREYVNGGKRQTATSELILGPTFLLSLKERVNLVTRMTQ